MAYNGSLIAEMFINLGSLDRNPSEVNCPRYAGMFQPTGQLFSPGMVVSRGRASVEKACEVSHSEVSPLVSFQRSNIQVTSWNEDKRMAFVWTLNGLRGTDGSAVSVGAISTLYMNQTGSIQDAFSFYDDSLLRTGVRSDAPPFNGSVVADKYTRFGASGKVPAVFSCTRWAALYAANGVNNEPGIPPSSGTADLEALCERRYKRWNLFLPTVQEVYPVMQWNTSKRVAFSWTLAGVSSENKATVVPAITMLMMTPDEKIQQAWDFWDESLLPPPKA